MNTTVDIKKIRDQLGMSQEVFGAFVGKTAKTLSRYERGLKTPPDGFYEKVQKIQRQFMA